MAKNNLVIKYLEQEIMAMIEISLYQAVDLNAYWSAGEMDHPYDCVIRGKLLGIDEKSTVYYNAYNKVILFEDDFKKLTKEIKKNAIYNFVNKNCKDLNAWINQNAEMEDKTPTHVKTDYERLLDKAACEFGFANFCSIDGRMENIVFAYAYCLSSASWPASYQGEIYESPLKNFKQMNFNDAIARVKLYLHSFNRQEEYLDTIVSTPEERIANALEKIANKSDRTMLNYPGKMDEKSTRLH